MNSNSNGKSSLLGTAVVTGASSGLGKVYADRLGQRGYDLLLVARRADRLQNLTEELRARHGFEANFIVADLGNDPPRRRL
jgi:short-subunit dehydrogenase